MGIDEETLLMMLNELVNEAKSSGSDEISEDEMIIINSILAMVFDDANSPA